MRQNLRAYILSLINDYTYTRETLKAAARELSVVTRLIFY